ncbi:MAG: hypothetical protein SFU98_18215 [Leptospiraceae bacterium]|nr:hypothetical protein [Leptospiraceae bacterium]
MEQNISRTDAHKIFANLYRKQRSAEHQAKVDEIITRSNDVFIRIDLIKKLDEEFDKKQREALRDFEKKNSNPNVTAVNKAIYVDKQTTARMPAVKNEGFIDRLFGGGNPMSKFAKESRAIEIGLLGRKPTITPYVSRVFRGLKEDEIISTAQALKYSEQVGWKLWNPIEYNIIANFSRFFNSFISLDTLFKDEISPDIFLARSTKMQMFYVRVLQKSNTKEIVLDKVPSLVKQDQRLAPKIDLIMRGLSYTLTLESRRPSLKDAIIAFHVVSSRKLPTWEEIEKNLNVSPLDETKYSASPEINKQIEMAVAKITGDINSKHSISEELEMIQRRYFDLNLTTKQVNFSFIDKMLDAHVNHFYHENPTIDAIRSNIRQSPPKLLQVVCRDIQTLYLPLIEGYIKLELPNGVKDVLIVQNGLFFAEIDKINTILRNIDAFNRKFPSFNYTFDNFTDNVAKGTGDQVDKQLMVMITDAADFFGKFAKKLTVVVENDELALKYEETGQINEKTLTTKEKIIEEIKIMQRFIPFAEGKYVSQDSRVSGKTVRLMFFEMTKMLYNYSLLFRDPSITAMLSSYSKLESELVKMYAEYERLTGKTFRHAGSSI